MDGSRIKAEARLVAIEYLLQRLHLIVYRLIGADLEAVKAVHQEIAEKLRSETFPSAEAVKSDLYAGEIEDAVRHQLSMIEQAVKEGRL